MYRNQSPSSLPLMRFALSSNVLLATIVVIIIMLTSLSSSVVSANPQNHEAKAQQQQHPPTPSRSLTISVATTSRECKGISRSFTYASGECVSLPTLGTSNLYSCTDDVATIKVFRKSDKCEGSEFEEQSIGTRKCASLGAFSSWTFECNSA